MRRVASSTELGHWTAAAHTAVRGTDAGVRAHEIRASLVLCSCDMQPRVLRFMRMSGL